jgi:hypothetical protein
VREEFKASMPQISEPNLVENRIIETYKEEECAVSKQEIPAQKNGKMEVLNTCTGSLDR